MARLTTPAALNIGDALPDAWVDSVKAAVDYVAIPGADLASAATLSITSEFHKVTGTTTVDNITDAAGAIAGQQVRLLFTGANISVRHNGGGTGNIRLVGGLHAGFVVGEILHLIFDGTNWYELARTPAHVSGEGGILWSGSGVPAGYLREDGSAILRATFAALFANIGTIHGVGDGSTTFNLPDSRGRVDVGYVISGGHTDVATIGLSDPVAVGNRRSVHNSTAPGHSLTVPNHKHGPEGGRPYIPMDYTAPPGTAGPGPGLMFDGGTFTSTGNPTTLPAISGSIGVPGPGGTAPIDTPAYLVRAKLIRV